MTGTGALGGVSAWDSPPRHQNDAASYPPLRASGPRAPCPWPRLESDTHLITTGSARPLEDAFRIAQTELVRWLEAEFGLAMLDAYQLVSQAVESPLANVVDTNYTSVAKIAKQYLPPMPAMRDTHARLAEAARVFRGGSGG